MKKKWIKDLGVNECIHAPTQEISDDLCKKFDEWGLKWSDGIKYIDVNYFSNYGDQTHYIPFNGTYCGLGYAESHCKVYTINDLLDFDGENVAVSGEGYTKEEIELLDNFAGLAMNGLVSKYGNEGTYSTLSQMSYEVAKAMIKERKEALKNV